MTINQSSECFQEIILKYGVLLNVMPDGRYAIGRNISQPLLKEEKEILFGTSDLSDSEISVLLYNNSLTVDSCVNLLQYELSKLEESVKRKKGYKSLETQEEKDKFLCDAFLKNKESIEASLNVEE